ncbi:MAG: hypothetical protein KC931_04765 [Candidatus Omnitrophica bacterium]|nr:hypothetical protein [Candidatus Omnitrophota bacterium]MCA9446404.1 hypothetical protein [Candidatus Omnitrophota bacterium]
MTESRPLPPLLWLNVLSLDAPLVAICWQFFFSRLFDRPIVWTHPFLLGAVTWLAYSGDRILDGMRAEDPSMLAPRHRFAVRYRIHLILTWILVFLLGLGVGVFLLERPLFWRGMSLTAGVAVYYLLVFLWPNWTRRVVPREFAVSLLFVAGTSCFVFTKADLKSVEVWNALIWFGAICFINCILIAFWEKEIDQQNAEVSAATTSPGLGRKANLLIAATLGVAALCWVASPFTTVRRVLFAVGLSLIFLFVLNLSRVSREKKPVLADMALLSPLLIVWFV